MKQLWCVLICLGTIVLYGCESKELIYYLQDLQVEAPPARIPIHITKERNENEIHVMASLTVSGKQIKRGRVDGHTRVNSAGVFQVDTVFGQDRSVRFRDPGSANVYEFTGKNLRWETPPITLGIDVDLTLGRRVALSLGATYAPTSSGVGLWRYRGGLGFFGFGKTIGYRLDVGWLWQEHSIVATTVLTERPLSSNETTVYFYEDRSHKLQGSFYAALTFNSMREESSFDYFLQIGFTRQVVSEYKPSSLRREAWLIAPYFLIPYPGNIVTDQRGPFAASLLQVTPGLAFKLDERLLLNLGLNVAFETSIHDLSSAAHFVPVLQLDWRL